MDCRTVRRGFAVVAFATVLGVAGAYPAAAEEIGLFERGLLWLSGLLGAQETGDEDGLFSIWAADQQKEIDKGMGVDPNGGTVETSPPSDEDQ